MEWAHILVIILSIFLALFLLLAIIFMIMLIRISRQIKTVTDSAQRTAENIERTIGNVTRITSPALFLKHISNFIKRKKRKE